jgi:hypothetical protein
MDKYLSYYRFIFFGYIILFQFNCEIKRDALGSDDEIIVISAMEDEEHLQSILSKIFNDTLFTPEPEPYYKLNFVSPSDYRRIKNSVHIVIGAIGNDPSNPAVELVKNILSDKQYKNSISGNKPIIISKDPYARNQLLMVINSPNIEIAEEFAIKNNQKIKDQYFSLFSNRSTKYMFNNARQNKFKKTF